VSDTLVRLPLWTGLDLVDAERVAAAVRDYVGG